MDRTPEIAKLVLFELDHFGQNYEVPTFAGSANDHVAQRSFAAYSAEKELATEPFVVYAKVYERDGRVGEWTERVYLVGRYAPTHKFKPATNDGMYCSRNAPVGRLASLNVGEELEVKIDRRIKQFELVEKSIFRPQKGMPWDAIRSVVYLNDVQEYLGSMREFLAGLGELDVEDMSAQGMALVDEIDTEARRRKEARKSEIRRRKRLQQRAIEQLALRDQPVLDSRQDLFCRAPIDAQIILIGAPGTGKTTTLVKRLAIVLDPKSRPEDEELTGEQRTLYYRAEPNWYLFTPSELLRRYLNDALGKEMLPSSNDFVRVWSTERGTLARDVFRITKSIEKGVFKLARKRTLVECTGPALLDLLDRFFVYTGEVFREEIDRALEKLQVASSIDVEAGDEFAEKVAALVASTRRAASRLKPVLTDPIGQDLAIVAGTLAAFRGRTRELRALGTERLQQFVNELIVADPDAIASVLEEMANESVSAVEAREAIRRTALALGRRLARKGKLPNKKSPKTAESAVLGRLEQDSSRAAQLRLIGAVRDVADAFGPITRGYRYLFESLPERYRTFRAQAIRTDLAYRGAAAAAAVEAGTIGDDETDLLVYAMLQLARHAFRSNPDWLVTPTKVEALDSVKERYRAHVTVDETTDFSILQVGCMMLLAHPRGGSVSLAGDLMQRMTHEGIADWEHVRKLSPRFETYELEKPYRHSPALQAVASRLYEIGTGEQLGQIAVADEDDPRPLRFESESREEVARWIAERIGEIYRIHKGRMVSVAVFVADDADINEAHELLSDSLGEYSIEVEKCHEGRVLGEGTNVRVFSVKYIKGLEFEAVFFLDLDRVSEHVPDLVDKYLYVGLTRAGTFLGVTSTAGFPEKLQRLEPEFEEGTWANYLP